MRAGMIDTQAIRQRWGSVGSKLDERGRRVFAAGEVRATGWGGLEAVSEITGLARSTIGRGLKDLDAAPLPKGRVRRKGGGRRHLSSRDTTLIEDLRNVIEPATLGDPMRPLLWVSKSYDKLASALQKKGHEISASSVKRLLPTLGYSRQSNRKADEGSKHPDRNAQFEHINAKAIAAQAARQPVISVDTKKKELIGNYKNGGTDYRPKGDPQRVKVHDFEDKELGKVVPYGVYDVGANAGWVSVGITSDTAQFGQGITAFEEREGVGIEQLAAAGLDEMGAVALVDQAEQREQAPPGAAALVHGVRIEREILDQPPEQTAHRIAARIIRGHARQCGTAAGLGPRHRG